MLYGVQKTKVIQKYQMDVLYTKANRFLTKDSLKKEKNQILKQAKEEQILKGGKSNNPETKVQYRKKNQPPKQQYQPKNASKN